MVFSVGVITRHSVGERQLADDGNATKEDPAALIPPATARPNARQHRLRSTRLRHPSAETFVSSGDERQERQNLVN
jgi:hypothetical protein